MPDPKPAEDDDGGAPTRDRWTTGADGIEQAGTATETEVLSTPDQKAGSAEYARRRDESLALARRLPAAGDDDEDAEETDDSRKD